MKWFIVAALLILSCAGKSIWYSDGYRQGYFDGFRDGEMAARDTTNAK